MFKTKPDTTVILEIHTESGVLTVEYNDGNRENAFRHANEAENRPEVLGAEILEKYENGHWRPIRFQ